MPKVVVLDDQELEEVEEVEDTDEVDSEREERPRRKKQNRNTNVKKRGGSNILLWLTLATLFLMMLGGGGAAAWWLLVPHGATDDLVFVPGNVVGFISVRPSDIATTPFAQNLISQLPPAAKKEFAAMPPNEVERLTVVFFDMKAAVPEEGSWVVLRSTKPLDKDKVLKETGDTYKEQQFQGKTFYVPSNPANPSLWLAGEQILVAGKGSGLQRAMSLPPVRETGPLDLVLGEWQANRHLVAAFIVPANSSVPPILPFPPQLTKVAQAVLDTNLITLIGDVADGASLDLGLNYPSDQKAKDAKEAIDKGVIFGKQLIKTATSSPAMAKRADPLNIMSSFNPLLSSIVAEQSGSVVNVKLNIDGAVITSIASAAKPDMMQGRGGANAAAGRPGTRARGAASPAKPVPVAPATGNNAIPARGSRGS